MRFSLRGFFSRLFLLFFVLWGALVLPFALAKPSGGGPIVVATIDGTINPATDEYLRNAIEAAEKKDAALLVLKLNTPGGLLDSMQRMVTSLLQSKVPTVVYVYPSGSGAISAGMFITIAGHYAVMAPGTQIGAAHPVTGGGDDIKGDMREKVENFAATLAKSIAEQRGKNTEWAEQSVRESVAITDREAYEKKVIDFIASDLSKLLSELEGKTVNVSGESITFSDLSAHPVEEVELTLKQVVLNVLCDPNIAIFLGLGAMIGIGIELYHPGGIFPGILGAICLVLSLTASQVIPINYGGAALLVLSVLFFAVEAFSPSFGLWGAAGIVSLILGSIYFVDTDMVWSVDGFEVNRLMVGSVAAIAGVLIVLLGFLVFKDRARPVVTGREGLIGRCARVKREFLLQPDGLTYVGKVQVVGELWNAKLEGEFSKELKEGQLVEVVSLGEEMTLLVRLLE